MRPTRDEHLSLLHLVDSAGGGAGMKHLRPAVDDEEGGCGRKGWKSSGVRTGLSKKVE